MDSNPMLSIYVPTFNHENYIKKALESILYQKTSYTYEVLVGDDCSTDNTASVLKQFQEEHPGFMTVFYRKSNMFNSDLTNSDDLKRRCRGKYMICLEGDDYWISPNKIEKQISFLEDHPEYLAVAHKCNVVDINGNSLNIKYPECSDSEYTYKHYLHGILPGQTTTVMVRNYVKEYLFDNQLIFNGHGPGDRRLVFSILTKGRIFVLPDVLSAYRYVTNSGSSFSANNKYNFKKLELISRDFVNYAHKNCDRNVIIDIESSYIREILKGIKTQNLTILKAIEMLKSCGLNYFCRASIRLAILKMKRDS